MADPTPTRFALSPRGERIAYRTLGRGGVPILILQVPSCVDLCWDDPVYAALMNRLAQAGQVITFDPRSLGSSDWPPAGELPTVEEWIDDGRVVLDAVGASRAFLLSLNPISGFAVMFAATYPERTAGLILVDGCARLLWDHDYQFGLPVDVLDPFIEALQDRTRSAEGAFDDVPSRAPDAVFAEFRARLHRLSTAADREAEIAKWCGRYDVRDLLSVVACSTLVVQPTGHPYLAPAFSEYLLKNIRNARLATRSGHENVLFSERDSEEVAALVHEFITGTPPGFDSNRSLATIMFTDIVGSTDHAARMGDQAWVALLARHDALVERELRRFRGRKVNTTGDGVVATFDGPARAVRCALAIRQGVAELGIQIRAGLHTGEIEHHGDDIGGIAVHVASRISTLAGPSEILVSRTVTDLALGSRIQFDDHGEHDLKGVPGTWRLAAVAD